MKIFLYGLLSLFGIVVFLLLIALVRTLFIRKKSPGVQEKADEKRTAKYGEIFKIMVQHETVSVKNELNPDKFRAFHQTLKKCFPHVFSQCEVYDIDGSLIVKYKGKSDKKPIMFLAHMDVVEANANDWTYPPFSGEIVDGKIYGRGTGDTKCSLFSAFQAVEESLIRGYIPEQDVYLGSGCSEETDGPGAPKMVKWLEDHHVRLALLNDEGGGIVSEPIKGLIGLYAMAGLYEKGYCNFKFTAYGNGGHSSAPIANSPIARLSKFVSYMDKHQIYRRVISKEVKQTFETLAPYCGFGYRFVLGNLWLLGGLLSRVATGTVEAMLGTTCAFTMMEGSKGENVIPQEAWVLANLRTSPFEGVDESFKKAQKVAARYQVETTLVSGREASKIANVQGEGYSLFTNAMKETFPSIPIVPYVVTGGTDARTFEPVCDTVIRMSPIIYTGDSIDRMHGIDEYLSIDSLVYAVDYYRYLIEHLGDLT